MKKLWPWLLVAGLLVLLFFCMKGCANRTIKEHTIIQAATTGMDSGYVWKDAYGREHRRAEGAVADRKTMELAYGRLMDSVARLNDVKLKQVEQISWLSTQLRGARTIQVLNTHEGDHTAVSFDYSDMWLSLQGNGNVYHDSLGSIQLRYFLRDSLVFTRIRQRPYHIGPIRFGAWRSSFDLASANPDVQITGLKTLAIKESPKRWGISAQLGAYWWLKWHPYAGLGISYNFIRF